MEFFGFASGNSCFGPNFPFLSESILKNYPCDLMDHPALPTVANVNFDSMTLPSVFQSLREASSSIWDKQVTRNLTAGVVAVLTVYGVWKISHYWCESKTTAKPSPKPKEAIDFDFEVRKLKAFHGIGDHKVGQVGVGLQAKKKDLVPQPAPPVPEVGTQTVDLSPVKITSENLRMITDEQLTTATAKFQRQLIEALSRLDDVRLRLKELDSEKELLAAEIELRKRMIQKLQDENTTERDKRQQAELRMEMMEIENAQLRQLRKELSLKTGQVERLEKFLKEKEELQEKLFEENVVLPRTVAESRAKEFSALQSRIQRLESEMAANRHFCDFDVSYQSSCCSADHALGSSEISSCHRVKLGQFSPPLLLLEDTNHSKLTGSTKSNSLAEVTMSMSKSSKHRNVSPVIELQNGDAFVGSREITPAVQETKSSCQHNSQSKRDHTISSTVGMSNSQSKRDTFASAVGMSKSQSKRETLSTVGMSRRELSSPTLFTVTEMHELSEVSKSRSEALESDSVPSQKGVLAQLKAFISGYRASSSESDTANTGGVPGLLDDLVARSDFGDNMKNGIRGKSTSAQSDGQSSAFVSASDGSTASDNNDNKAASNMSNKSVAKRMHSGKRTSHGGRSRGREKGKHSKRRATAQNLTCTALSIGHEENSSTSSEHSHQSRRSTISYCPLDGQDVGDAEKSVKTSTGDRGFPAADDTSTLESSDENDGDSGDSWIVIMPTTQ